MMRPDLRRGRREGALPGTGPDLLRSDTTRSRADKFTRVSPSCTHDPIVKKPDNSGVAVAYYRNHKYLTEKTADRDPYVPVKLSRYTPSGPESYRTDTWIP
jgi:hypothetical protein